MFRRRPFRRRVPGPVPARRRAGLERLQRANQLMSEGSFNEAGRIFEELAAGAARMRIPRAPQLFLQAGNAMIKAGEIDHGITLLGRGFHLMERMGQYQRLPVASQRVLNELESLGLDQEREALEKEIQQLLAQKGLSLSAETQHHKPRLPGKCPQCGGTVHPNEVEWIDERTASCDYCGSILEG
jgi:hypothetical protein